MGSYSESNGTRKYRLEPFLFLRRFLALHAASKRLSHAVLSPPFFGVRGRNTGERTPMERKARQNRAKREDAHDPLVRFFAELERSRTLCAAYKLHLQQAEGGVLSCPVQEEQQ